MTPGRALHTYLQIGHSIISVQTTWATTCDKVEITTGPDPDFGLQGGGGGTTQHEGTGHHLIKSQKIQ